MAAKSVELVQILKRGLECIKRNLDPLEYDNTSLLSCMILDVENLLSVVHHRNKVSTASRYARDFGKERLKRTTSWPSAYYYTSRGLWYLFEIPPIPLSSAIKATQDEISMMQEWARAHRSSVQQRSVRQNTTMATVGTLPDYLYQNEIQVGEKISLQSSNNAKTGERPHQDKDDEQHGTVEDGVSEFDSSSDEETCADEAFVEEESDLGNEQFT